MELDIQGASKNLGLTWTRKNEIQHISLPASLMITWCQKLERCFIDRGYKKHLRPQGHASKWLPAAATFEILILHTIC